MKIRTETRRTFWVEFTEEQIEDFKLVIKVIDGHGFAGGTLSSVLSDTKNPLHDRALETWNNFKASVGDYE